MQITRCSLCFYFIKYHCYFQEVAYFTILKYKMNYNDIIGTIGVGLILLAYCFNTFSLIPRDGKLFFIMNIIGAGLACYASILINYVPFIILEGVWCAVSVAGFIQLISKIK